MHAHSLPLARVVLVARARSAFAARRRSTDPQQPRTGLPRQHRARLRGRRRPRRLRRRRARPDDGRFRGHGGRQAAARSAASPSRKSANRPAPIETAELLAGARRELAAESRRTPAAPAPHRPRRSRAEADDLGGARRPPADRAALRRQLDAARRRAARRGSAPRSTSTRTMTPADMVAVASISSMLNVLTDFTRRPRDGRGRARDARLQGRHRHAAADRRHRRDRRSRSRADDTTSTDTMHDDGHVQQRRPAARAEGAGRDAGADRAEESRSSTSAPACSAAAKTTRSSCGRRSTRPCGARLDLSGGHARPAGNRPGRRRDARQRPRHGALLGQRRGQQFSQLLCVAGHARLAGRPTPAAARSSTRTTSRRRSRACSATCRRTTCSATPAPTSSKDGRFRTIQVRVKQARTLKVEARGGYYADRDFAHTARDRSRDAAAGADVLGGVGDRSAGPGQRRLLPPRGGSLLRADRGRRARIRRCRCRRRRTRTSWRSTCSASSATSRAGRSAASGRRCSCRRESIGTLASQQILYQSAVTLPPGRFSVKVVVRENTSGLMGSFEAPVIVPELKQAPLKVSSVAAQHAGAAGEGHEGQPADPQRRAAGPEPDAHRRQGPEDVLLLRGLRSGSGVDAAPDVRTSLAFYRGKVKVFETPVVERLESGRPVAGMPRCSSSRSRRPRCRLASTPARSTSSTRSRRSSPSRA